MAAPASGNQNDRQNNYEFQNYTSLIHGNHTLKFGARVRADTRNEFFDFRIQWHVHVFFVEHYAQRHAVELHSDRSKSAVPHLSISMLSSS